jgi:hypothetical protein
MAPFPPVDNQISVFVSDIRPCEMACVDFIELVVMYPLV